MSISASMVSARVAAVLANASCLSTMIKIGCCPPSHFHLNPSKVPVNGKPISVRRNVLSKPIDLDSSSLPTISFGPSAIAGAIFASLGSCESALALQQIADIAEGGSDNRVLALLLPIIPAILWVLYNILQPALNQINRMRSDKGVLVGFGLGGLTMAGLSSGVHQASAAEISSAAAATSSDAQGLLLMLVVAPAVPWVFYNILQPALNQINRMSMSDSSGDVSYHGPLDVHDNFGNMGLEEHHDYDTTGEREGDVPSTSGSKKSKTRGPTLRLSLWKQKYRVHIDYDNHGRPIGPDVPMKDLHTFIGCLARRYDLCPLYFASWNAVEDQYKEKAYNEIKLRFTTQNDNPKVKKVIMSLLGLRWKGWKYNLKKKYFVLEDRQASIEACDDKRVNKEQWAILVDYWLQENVQAKAALNRANRHKLSVFHTQRTSIATKKRRMEEEGQTPDRADVFITSHVHDDGRVHSSEEIAVEQIRRAKDTTAMPSSAVGETPFSAPGDIFSQVLGNGRRGRLRSSGVAVTAINTRGFTRSNHASENETHSITQEILELRARVEDAEKRAEESEAQYRNMEERFRQSEEQTMARQRELESQLALLMTEMQKRQS